MSFGYSIGDFVLLTQLAWRVVDGARKACGEHDELTREVSSLHVVLQRVREDLANPNSVVSWSDDDRGKELGNQISGCEHVLKVMDEVLTKYNALENGKRTGKRLWQKIQFGNGEMKDLAEMRLKISTHTAAITMSLNLLSLGSQGRVETQLSRQEGDLHGIRESINWITARMAAVPEQSVMTTYTNDSKAFWREMRRELVRDGYNSSVVQNHKRLIKAYVKELADRGVLDEPSSVSDLLPLTVKQLLQTSIPRVDQEVAGRTGETTPIDYVNEIQTSTEVFDQRSSIRAVGDVSVPLMPELVSNELPMKQDHVKELLDLSSSDRYTEGLQAFYGQNSPREKILPNYAERIARSKEPYDPSAPADSHGHEEQVVDLSTGISFWEGPKETNRQDFNLKRKVSICQENLITPSENKIAESTPEKVSRTNQGADIVTQQDSQFEQKNDVTPLAEPDSSASVDITPERPIQVQLNASQRKWSSQYKQSFEEKVCAGVSHPETSEGGLTGQDLLQEITPPTEHVSIEDAGDSTNAHFNSLPAIPVSSQTLRTGSNLKVAVPGPPVEEPYIKFLDAVGRKYQFPFRLCRTWEGMENLILQAFEHVEFIGLLVQARRYDLVGPNDLIILPVAWESTIETYMEIHMQMWPLEEGLTINVNPKNAQKARFSEKKSRSSESPRSSSTTKQSSGQSRSFTSTRKKQTGNHQRPTFIERMLA